MPFLSEFRESLNYEGFREIDGYRQEKANNVQYHLANAAYHALGRRHAPPTPGVPSLLEITRLLETGFPTDPQAVREVIERAAGSLEVWVPPDMTAACSDAAWAVAHSHRRSDTEPVSRENYLREGREQVPLVHDVFGNPFRPDILDPAWRTEAVVALAAGIYADRAFERLPVLADALEDAGCGNTDILSHCRSDGPHVRGCWVVDLLLGKE